MQPILVFDIETIPDLANAQKILALDHVEENQLEEAVLLARRDKNPGKEQLPLHLQKIIVISLIYRDANKFKLWSVNIDEGGEKNIIQRFFEGIEKYTPTLVSWNGNGFDLPVLHYRALIHSVSAKRYWEIGNLDNQFKWNNYINRYHYRHLDIMDILAAYQPRAFASLNDVAHLLNLPGKIGMHGSEVWPNYKKGKLAEIQNYCETDVLNTYLIYLRFELLRGTLTEAQLHSEYDFLKAFLKNSDKLHLHEFLNAWQEI